MRYILSFLLVLSFTILYAQVPVREEPRHKPVFQNKQIRILDVNIPPGDTSLYHLHELPSVFFNFTSSKTFSQQIGKEPEPGNPVAGRILFEDLSPPHTRTHRVWNNDKDTFHVMDIEIIDSNYKISKPRFTIPGYTLEADHPALRVYRLTLKPNESFRSPDLSRDFMLIPLEKTFISLSDGKTLGTLTINAGHFYYFKKGNDYPLKNLSKEPRAFALVEWGE